MNIRENKVLTKISESTVCSCLMAAHSLLRKEFSPNKNYCNHTYWLNLQDCFDCILKIPKFNH